MDGIESEKWLERYHAHKALSWVYNGTLAASASASASLKRHIVADVT